MSHNSLQNDSPENASKQIEQSSGASMQAPAFQLMASSGDESPDNPGTFQGRKRPKGEEGGSSLLANRTLKGGKDDAGQDALSSVASSLIGTASSIWDSVSNWWGSDESESGENEVAEELTMSHKTLASAPDGSGNDRKNVGVGEIVTFKSSQSGSWTATSGNPTTQDSGDEFLWIAPNRAANVTVKVTVGDQVKSVTMNVKEPTSMTADKNREKTFSPGDAGAGMFLTFNYHPKTVSFGGVEAREVSGPGTNVSGYFKDELSTRDVYHDSGDTFYLVGEDNKDTAEDEAAGGPLPGTIKDGTLDWVIPNFFRVEGESGDGKKIQDVTQTFRLKADGTLKIKKLNKEVERKP